VTTSFPRSCASVPATTFCRSRITSPKWRKPSGVVSTSADRRRLPTLKKTADDGVAFEADGHVVRMTRFVVRAGSREQVGARGPVRLVLGETRIGGDGLKRVERRGRAVDFGDRERTVNRHDRRS